MLPFRPPIKLALLGTFWIIFLLGQFIHLPLPNVGNFLGVALTALLSCFAAFGWGVWPVHVLLPQPTKNETILFSMGLGWGILSLWMIILGLFHGWVPISIYGLIGIGSLLGAVHLKAQPQIKLAFAGSDWKGWAWITVPSIIIGSLLALAPPTYYDSLVYHLALPAAYLHAGHWVGWTDLIYSGFPQNLEMLWTFGLLTGLPSMPGVIGWSLALLLLFSMDHWCRRHLDGRTGKVAVAFMLMMPAFLLSSSGGYVDMGLALYFFLSLYALSLASDDDGNGPALLGGFFAGLAAGIKYTGILSIALGVVWILIDARAQRLFHTRARAAALFTLVALAVFAPWIFKNMHYFGNPVFPFFYAWGNARLNPWASGAQGYFRALVEYQPHSIAELPALLWTLAVNSFAFGRGADVLGDFGWALMIAFLPLLAWVKEKNSQLTKMAGYALLFFCSWGMTRPVLRFLLPIAPLLAILAAYGWTQAAQAGDPWLARSMRVVLGALVLSNAILFFQITDVFKPFRVPLGLETKDVYLNEKLNYFGAASFINRTTDPKAEIIVVGDQRSYYYERKVTAWTVFNENPIVSWADRAASVSALRAELRRHGSVMVVNRAEMQRLAPYHALDFSMRGGQNWDGVLNDARASTGIAFVTYTPYD